MAHVTTSKNSFTLKAYVGDNKTLLAFNFASKADAANLAGFTISCQPPGESAYYLWNELQFQDPTKHAQISTEKPNSTANAPIQKFRWTHVPGTNHQGLNPAVGNYRYVVTPRFFDSSNSMKALDGSLSASATVPVGPFKKDSLTLGFTRGYMQSEAFAHHFGKDALIEPTSKPLQFSTAAQAGAVNGQVVTFADIYSWMGSTARQQIFSVLNAVLNDPSLYLNMLAYDLNEPDVVKILLELAAQGRVSIILDNSPEHHDDANPLPEDRFATLFNQQAKAPAAIERGCFARYAHDKILIVSKNGSAIQVLTGATNFSVNGLYVNANHTLFFDDPTVAQQYSKVFGRSWEVLKQFPMKTEKAASAFAGTPLATTAFDDHPPTVPEMSVTFAPHTKADALGILNAIVARINQEATASNGNVLFAVMQITGGTNPVYDALNGAHLKQSMFSYGISDAPKGVYLYSAHSKVGVLVTGKPSNVNLPPPFDQLPSPPGHEIHDKFVVCGLNGTDPVVYCGSSNLAAGGEQENGDNLLEIHDADVATAFAIEALLLIDHYDFLDRYVTPKMPKPAAQTSPKKPSAKKSPVKPKSAR